MSYPSRIPNQLLYTTYDPTKQNIPQQHTPFSPPQNTSTKHLPTNMTNENRLDSRLDSQSRQQGLPTHPILASSNQTARANNLLVEKISDKIYNHFKQ